MDLTSLCHSRAIPVAGEDEGDFMIAVAANSELPSEAELEWLLAYRCYRENRELTDRQIADMYAQAIRDGQPLRIPPSLAGLHCYTFIKFGPGDWGYRSEGWQNLGYLPASPVMRRWCAEHGESHLGQLSLPSVLDAVTGHVDTTIAPPAPVPAAAWTAWVHEYRVRYREYEAYRLVDPR